MKISEIIQPSTIKLDITVTARREIISELVGLLHLTGNVTDPAAVVQMVWKRECEVGTGIGFGVAIPHSDPANYDRPHLAFGRLKEAADFTAPDSIPVRLVFLLLSPDDQPALHIRFLARLCRLLKSSALRDRLFAAISPGEAYSAIAAAEAEYPDLLA